MDRWSSSCQCRVESRYYPIENGSCSFFFLVWLGYMKRALQLFLTPNHSSFHLLWHMPSFTTFNPSHIALSRTRMPSFTLVLTSGWHSLDGHPTAIKFDPCASYTMLPVVIDHFLVTSLLFLCGNHDANLYVPVADRWSTRWASGQQSGTYRPIGELGVSWLIVNILTCFYIAYQTAQIGDEGPPSVCDTKKKVARAAKVCRSEFECTSSFNIYIL